MNYYNQETLIELENANAELKQRIAELEEKLAIQTKRGDLASPAMNTAYDLKELYDEACKERDELAATVERLREVALDEIIKWAKGDDELLVRRIWDSVRLALLNQTKD